MEPTQTNYSLLYSLIAGSRRPETWQMFDAAYRPVILQWCQWRGLQASDAEDVTQAVFFKLNSKIATYDSSKGRFSPWLASVVRHEVIDFMRSVARSPGGNADGSTTIHALLENLESDESIAELSLGLETRERLVDEAYARVAANVTEKTWKMYWAVKHEGRPAAEVAAEAGIKITSLLKNIDRVQKAMDQETENVLRTSANWPLSGSIGAEESPG